MSSNTRKNPRKRYLERHAGVSRRTLLAAAGGLTLGATAFRAGPAAAAGVFDPDWLVEIAANPSFAFTKDLTNSGAGESSPIADAYHLCKYKVTNAQYASYLDDIGAGGTYAEGKGDHPVLAISATEAAAYCAWLTASYGDWVFRLPTEAEWENAARGTAGYAYPWGDSLDTSYSGGVLTSHCNYNAVVAAYALAEYGDTEVTYVSGSAKGESVVLSELLSISATGALSGWIDTSTKTGFVYTDLFQTIEDEGGYTSAVGGYPSGDTATGLCDMGGDAWDWTSSDIVATNGEEKGETVKAVRGGSWYASSRSCATWYRGEGRDPDGGTSTVGMRVAAVPA